MIRFGYNYTGYNYQTKTPTGGTGWVQWYVNSTTTPMLRLDFDSSGTRWDSFYDIAGMVFGSMNGNYGAGVIDDIQFQGNIIPEPSSMLALGAGLMGLAGMIRRRR